MTEKEMIEEMAEDWDYVAHMLRFNDCYMLSLKKWSEPAREMIKLGWIKPNKNLVVLSREEYEKLKQYEEKARKETAREIIQLLDGHQFEDDGWTWSVSKRDLKFIAKKYGVEIEGGNEND